MSLVQVTGLTCAYSNFDNSVQRIKMWISDRPTTPSAAAALSPSSSSAQLAGLSMNITAGAGSADGGRDANAVHLTSSQRKRIKAYLKRCRMNPRHSQLNLEGYLLLPVQRIPRYKLLVRATVDFIFCRMCSHAMTA